MVLIQLIQMMIGICFKDTFKSEKPEIPGIRKIRILIGDPLLSDFPNYCPMHAPSPAIFAENQARFDAPDAKIGIAIKCAKVQIFRGINSIVSHHRH